MTISGSVRRVTESDQTGRPQSAGWMTQTPPSICERVMSHKAFWRGEGPSLILIPTEDVPLYDTTGYAARFHDPAKMWEGEMKRARAVIGWPTDGIPTVRPNLGTIFVPALTGQEYLVPDDQMPWVGATLSRQAIRAARSTDLSRARLLHLAEAFYQIHGASGESGIFAYHPDTQGVFDIAHLLYGDGLFLEMMDSETAAWIDELLEICLDLMVRATRRVKQLLGEPDEAMVHGHATPQGIYFPDAGIRISEDTATLISPQSIERFVLPMIERAAAPFGGAFFHYCGRHPAFFEMLCRMPCVRAIDLGNPESYDTRWLMERCAATGTVLHSRLAVESGENWEQYTRRLGRLVRETGVRCVLRPLLCPAGRDECLEMKELWHDLTIP